MDYVAVRKHATLLLLNFRPAGTKIFKQPD